MDTVYLAEPALTASGGIKNLITKFVPSVAVGSVGTTFRSFHDARGSLNRSSRALTYHIAHPARAMTEARAVVRSNYATLVSELQGNDSPKLYFETAEKDSFFGNPGGVAVDTVLADAGHNDLIYNPRTAAERLAKVFDQK